MSRKDEKKKQRRVPIRLNILFFIVFLLFSVLILQLGVVQILNGEAYQKEIDRTIKDRTKIPVPRGKIYDRNQTLIVDNKSLYSITYTPPKGVQARDRLKVAKELSKYITMYDANDPEDKKKKIKTITERDRKEYWFLLGKNKKNEKLVNKRLTKKEKEELDHGEQYKLMLERITEEEIAQLTEKDEDIILIKKELDKAYSLTPQIVKNEGVTPTEYALVAEHLDELPGINATTDWDREYPLDDTLKNLLGSITTEKRGIPKEKVQHYLAKGYSRNDRVGISGLEEQYEDVLRGRKEQIEYTTDKKGNIIDAKTVVEGKRGKDLVLTIDIEYQERLVKVVQKHLKNAINHSSANRFLEDAIAIAMDPKTGEILALTGQHYNRKTGKFESHDYKVLYDAHRPGSAIKGATVLAGFQSGVATPGQQFFDTPIKIAGTPVKKSVNNMGWVNDLEALRRSSNVYMFNIAMRMGGEYHYSPNKNIKFNPASLQEIRNYFSQFGLGVKTGVDYPYEATGYKGSNPPNLLDYSIGQYDTYTAIQLVQYISTIANGGYRMKPHFVKEIHEPIARDDDELGPVYKNHHPEVLNRVQMKDEWIERVQQGLRLVYSSGTASRFFSNKPYNPAGKTGTAENEVHDEITGQKLGDTNNLVLVGYAPFDEPEIAFAVIVPNLGAIRGQYPISNQIGQGILDEYFDLKKSREQGTISETGEDEE
ncbi:MAG TPA: penicillin-binding protein 2 [Cerasibacillus sp.]|uniref:peptidoglycan D,D-transpeptidase FtsI family protein n=1 Tax=Cerasibacillus sp. TaxID=2498711 RepID=UPI002F400BE6